MELSGGVYHVVARGNERRAIFRDTRDREIYLDRLADCRERLGFRVLAYCLMDNRLHLALERGPVALSRIMLALQSFYSQKFNFRHRRVGHLFQGRYKAFLVQKERQGHCVSFHRPSSIANPIAVVVDVEVTTPGVVERCSV